MAHVVRSIGLTVSLVAVVLASASACRFDPSGRPFDDAGAAPGEITTSQLIAEP